MDVDATKILARLETIVDRLEVVLADHEARLRKLEDRMAYAAGVVALILVAAPFVFKALQ
jgi:hypothetical protein